MPPGPRGGGPRLWESTSVREVRLSTTIPGNFDFYTVLCGGAPRGGGPRGGGPLGGGPRGGGPRGGPPMVFYARGCPLVPSGCIRSENGPRPATLLQRDRTKSFRQQQRRGAAYAPKNLAASGSPASPSGRCRRPKAKEAYHSSLLRAWRGGWVQAERGAKTRSDKSSQIRGYALRRSAAPTP